MQLKVTEWGFWENYLKHGDSMELIHLPFSPSFLFLARMPIRWAAVLGNEAALKMEAFCYGK